MEPKLSCTPEGDYCPVRATLALVGQKWVPHIVYQLMEGKLRFNELAAEVGGCNSRTLRDRLKALEELGIVSRRIVATMPPWVEYGLTERGEELGRALQPLAAWGRSHLRGSVDALEPGTPSAVARARGA
ncbi:MAG: helix-turn-helix transcriptional regulator [Chloroflexi bacterium]|nr:helix-turn-helix transcriptional regulator [Chloroflexota bacterium]